MFVFLQLSVNVVKHSGQWIIISGYQEGESLWDVGGNPVIKSELCKEASKT